MKTDIEIERHNPFRDVTVLRLTWLFVKIAIALILAVPAFAAVAYFWFQVLSQIIIGQ